jgi:Holliday junction DNA helicase RuvA
MSFRVHSTAHTLNQLGAIGSKVHLYTFLRLKNEELALYGFASMEELELFKMLLSVNGVSFKGAINILSALTPEQLSSAIANGQVEALDRLPGVGKKLASRLILELKGKLGRQMAKPSLPAEGEAELVAALTNLGFSVAEATKAIAEVPSSAELDLEARVKLALSHLSK